MKIRLLLSLAFLWAACATAIAAPTVQISPSASPADAASPAAQPTAASESTAAPVELPDTFEQIKGVDDLPLPQDGPGLWRLYDEEAQVVCYLYGANRAMGDTVVAWSGLSCLPASETRLGQR